MEKNIERKGYGSHGRALTEEEEYELMRLAEEEYYSRGGYEEDEKALEKAYREEQEFLRKYYDAQEEADIYMHQKILIDKMEAALRNRRLLHCSCQSLPTWLNEMATLHVAFLGVPEIQEMLSRLTGEHMNSYIEQQVQKRLAEQPNHLDPTEPLSYFIHDAVLRKQVIDIAENQCTKANHVKKYIYDLLISKGFDDVTLKNCEFLKALKTHLVQMPNIDIPALQRAFRENM